MRKLFKMIFISNWQRKLLSLVLATIIWILVYNSIVVEKNYRHIPVRLAYIPSNIDPSHLTSNGYLKKSVSLKIKGYKREKLSNRVNASFYRFSCPNKLQIVDLSAYQKDFLLFFCHLFLVGS